MYIEFFASLEDSVFVLGEYESDDEMNTELVEREEETSMLSMLAN